MTDNDLIQAEARLRAAMLAGDAEALDGLLADDLVFTDHLGRALTKAEDLAVHRSGRLRLREIRVDERATRAFPGGGIVAVRVHLVGSYDGAAFAGDFRYTRLWREGAGGARVAAAHASIVAQVSSVG